MNSKIEWWDNFNHELFSNYLIIKDEKMNTYKITYKYYRGNNDVDFEPCFAIKYIKAQTRQEAIKLFGMWPKLIINIEQL